MLLVGLTPPILDVVFALQPSPPIPKLAQDPPPPPPPPVQNPPPTQNPPQEEQAIRLTSRLVQVPVSASDALGRPVRDLTAESFVVEEQGKRQTIASLGEPGKVPTEIAMLFDVSGSTLAKFNFEQQAAVRFIKEVLKPTDAVSVFAIAAKPKMIKSRTASSEEAINGLMTLEPVKGEPTA